MVLRILLFLIIAASQLVGAHRHAHRSPATYSSADLRVLRLASIREPHDGLRQTVRRLERHGSIRSAELGPDGKTIEIEFTDGLSSSILPSTFTKAKHEPATPATRALHVSTSPDSSRRALVLEPFATEQIGTHDADGIISDLQASGYQVDQLSDQAVTVASMASLWKYKVIYMHTHGGVNKWGYAVVATGQQANGDPSVEPLIQNGSVMVTGVTGLSELFYGILIPYIQNYESEFPANSMIYIDTCNLLEAPPFWDALAAKGVGVLVSWDNESDFRDNTPAAKAFFDTMAQGGTVAAALQAVRAAGYGTSTVKGQVAHLGYVGDGYVTLEGRQAPPPTPTPLPVTPSPTPSATPTPSPVPSATSTVVTAAPLFVHLKSAVKPGSRQVISIKSSPNLAVHIRVDFPNGNHQVGNKKAGPNGIARYGYIQRPSEIRHDSQIARVTITLPDRSGVSATRSYRIGFGPIDVSAEPRIVHAGEAVDLWVHAPRFAAVSIQLWDGGKSLADLHAHAGARGWAHRRYAIARNGPLTAGQTIRVRARYQEATRRLVTSSSFLVE
jgi:hypothetical protein